MAKCLIRLKNNPFDPTLRTHKVNSKRFGFNYSSTITGDLRFIWDFDEENSIIEVVEIFDLGEHSGKDGVY